MPELRANERSEAIELIKESQRIFDSNDLFFTEATGEQSLKKSDSYDQRANTLFPDILYYEDKNQFKVALGWELKMPDTDINDAELLSNAIDKANRLRTNSFVLWNFKQVIVYYRVPNGRWEISKQWNDLHANKTREDVIANRELWKSLLQKVIIHLNKLFINKVISTVPVLLSAETIAEDIAKKYSSELANYYLTKGDRLLLIEIKRWYNNELLEFSSKSAEKVKDEEKAQMFAKNILINWVNRITFSSFLKENHNAIAESLFLLLDENETFDVIADSFNKATEVSDFYTILHCETFDAILSKDCENVLKEYASFLNDKEFKDLDQEEFQTTLESIVEVSKRELMGLYTTPKKLARLLVYSTLNNLDSKMIDPCVGSGTIVNTEMNLLSKTQGIAKAHKNIWASDKYRMPLQVANISMSSKESLNLPNIVFQKDLLNLRVGEVVKITNPANGQILENEVPEFDYVLSNLPFIRSERIDEHEKEMMKQVNKYLESKGLTPLNLKNDWYQFGIVGIERILKEGGKAALITSNSWLKTKEKKNYIETLFSLFEVEKIIVSSKGRWFNNADVVTTILVVSKKKCNNKKVQFIKLTSDINKLSDIKIEEISDSLLMNDSTSPYYKIETYTEAEITDFLRHGLSLNVLFNDMKWFSKIKSLTIPMKAVFTGRRGVKSTNDKYFYDIPSNEKIESKFLKPVLKSPTTIKDFYADADSNVFFVRENYDSLKKYNEAYKYIKKYDLQPKTKSQLELKIWYQYPDPVYGDFVTSLNPDQRLFWSSVPGDLIINQRLTVFSIKNTVKMDKRLIHALLNTYFAQFMIEATGFGRGLGVLDTTKDGILDSIMFDFNIISKKDCDEIIKQWEEISQGPVLNILEQLENDKWLEFNKLVFNKFGIEHILSDLISSFREAIILRSSI